MSSKRNDNIRNDFEGIWTSSETFEEKRNDLKKHKTRKVKNIRKVYIGLLSVDEYIYNEKS